MTGSAQNIFPSTSSKGVVALSRLGRPFVLAIALRKAQRWTQSGSPA
jgi:hypothetical protein